jgi:RNA recognition motif-containing protein
MNKEEEEERIEDGNNTELYNDRGSDSDSEFSVTETQRKLFIGGLSWQTTEDTLKTYFESLGFGIEKVVIMKDKVTGRSRGFGFITLINIEDVDKVVAAKLHLGRKIEAKRAIPKRDMENNSRKLFVGGVPINLNPNDFRSYFEKYGTVTDAQIMTERNSGHSRGFGFVTFDDDDVARHVLSLRHSIQGKLVEVKKAQPKKLENVQPVIIQPYPIPFFGYPPMYAPVYTPGFYPQSYEVPYLVPQGGFVYAPHYVEPSQQDSRNSTGSRKSLDAPALLRPKQLNSRTSPLLYLVSPERTQRAFSAGPGFNATNSSNVRKRGMSHPPAVDSPHVNSSSNKNRGSISITTSKEERLHKYFQ